MTLTSGARLGPYEIQTPLGAGGMGEVYKASDVRLNRTVAIKILPTHFSADDQMKLRFEREAKTVAALNHPNICALYDIGHHNDSDFLVMEFVDGETLASRLKRGALPLDQVLKIGIQIADALDRAHRAGILHRDLKPSNIMVGKTGVKLLDFGLAKLQHSEQTDGMLGMSAAITETPLTGQGTIVGTLHYMAPERLEGGEADQRADIWALGCILYEMAAGGRTFEGASRAGVIAAILQRSPEPLSHRQPLTPPALERLVARCIEKDPENRWQNARDVLLELRAIASGDVSSSRIEAVTPRRRRFQGAVAAVALAVLLIALWWWSGLATKQSAQVLRLSVFVGTDALEPGAPVISPDGTQLAFVASGTDGTSRLWLRPLDSLSQRAIDDSEGATAPFWSPDSRYLAFFARGKLKKVELGGNAPQVIADAPNGVGGSWNQAGVIIFAPDTGAGLHRVSAWGGNSVPLTKIESSVRSTTHLSPWFLPDGDHFLYVSQELGELGSGVYVTSLRHPEQSKRLLDADSNAAYSSGVLLYARRNTLMAQPFDAQRLELGGEAVSIAQNIAFAAARGSYWAFSVSSTGILCYMNGNRARRQFVWFNRDGRILGKIGPPGHYRDFDLSPNGKELVVAREDPERGLNDLWLMDLERGTVSRLGAESVTDPIWSPDGARVAFSVQKKLFFDIYQQAPAANTRDEAVVTSEQSKFVEDWSKDGRFIIYETGNGTRFDLWFVPTFGPREPRPFLQTPYKKDEPHFSPDGRWVAFNANDTGRWEVYIASFPDAQHKYQVSATGGAQPRWRRDGRELFYLSLDGTMMVVKSKAADGFSAGVPAPLFGTPLQTNGGSDQYAVTADGERFLLNTVLETEKSPTFTAVLNWAASLKK
jgi:serine/threonine protein kinase